MHVHILTTVCDQKQGDWDTHTHTGTGAPGFDVTIYRGLCNHGEFIWTLIHVLMHVHILKKVGEQK